MELFYLCSLITIIGGIIGGTILGLCVEHYVSKDLQKQTDEKAE